MTSKTIFSGALQLLRWSETSNQGATVTFQLADPADLERFKDLTMAKKGMAGQIIAAVMKTVDEDEAEVTCAPPSKPKKPKGGALAKLAGQWCNDAEFRVWLKRHGDFVRDVSPETAADVIRSWCKVDSRRKLDHNEAAAALFNEHFRLPYMAWQQGRHK